MTISNIYTLRRLVEYTKVKYTVPETINIRAVPANVLEEAIRLIEAQNVKIMQLEADLETQKTIVANATREDIWH